MAERRMVAKNIIDSDLFLDMPLSAQALYFHLLMRADDDGFLNNANRIMRTIGANHNDFDILLIKNFILKFDDGICVIKHWRIHNYIQTDRYHETNFKDKKELLSLEDNKAYTFETTNKKLVGNKIVTIDDTKCIQGDSKQLTDGKQNVYSEKDENIIEVSENQASEDCIHDVYSLEPQSSLGKSSLGKSSLDKERKDENSSTPVLSFPTPIHELVFNQFGETCYKTWFFNVDIEIEDNILKIIVPTELSKTVIQKYSNSISTLTGKKVSIHVKD